MSDSWVIAPKPDSELVGRLAADLSVPEPIAALLVQRGITDFDSAKDFFRPDWAGLHDPFLMKNMDRAVERLTKALENNERILIYGDYDVDGTTAVALMLSFLGHFTDQLDFYIPDRYREGYGLSKFGVQYAEDNGFSLIIALDCGIRAIDSCDKAAKAGIDVIICDHHEPGDQLPQAIILDPKQKDCEYPFKGLSGCGVGFKLAQGYCNRQGLGEEYLTPVLDLLVVSIAADIVPVVDENRILAHHGLAKLNSAPQPGIRALMELTKEKPTWNISDVVFGIAPKINAAGRMESGAKAVQLLITDDIHSARRMGMLIDADNKARKDLDKRITAEALELLSQDPLSHEAATSVVYRDDWHKGVIGIVASRLIETYHRPTVVLTRSNGVWTGSARSIKGFNLFNVLAECQDVLEQFGGHQFAAGLTIREENIPRFKQMFEEKVKATLDPQMLRSVVHVDLELEVGQLISENGQSMPKFYRILRQMGPFGPENMRPVFITRGWSDQGDSRVVGGSHLKLKLQHPDVEGVDFDGIAFGLGDALDLVQSGPVDVVYSLEENHWRGRTTLQLEVRDIRASES